MGGHEAVKRVCERKGRVGVGLEGVVGLERAPEFCRFVSVDEIGDDGIARARSSMSVVARLDRHRELAGLLLADDSFS